MYVLNILITITLSIVNIVGSILTGKIPKGSMWQIVTSNLDFSDTDYWYENDIAYKWRSRDEIHKMLNNKILDQSIDNFCRSKQMQGEEYPKLTEQEITFIKERLKVLVKDYNRIIL